MSSQTVDLSLGARIWRGFEENPDIGEFTLQWRSFLGTETKLFGADSSNDFDEIGIYVQKTW
tara:strand:- start:46530 stop:46715 length:186 start_codon:yes stop_codon:yes gene_type:complete